MDDEQWAPVTERRWKIAPKTKPRVNVQQHQTIVQPRTIDNVQPRTATVLTNDTPCISKYQRSPDQINQMQRKIITETINKFEKKHWNDPQSTKILCDIISQIFDYSSKGLNLILEQCRRHDVKDPQTISKWYRSEHCNTYNFRDFMMMMGYDITMIKTWEDNG